MRRAQVTTISLPAAHTFWGGIQVIHYRYVPMAASPVRVQENSQNFLRQRSFLLPVSSIWKWPFPCSYIIVRYIYSTVHIQAALGGVGPRWQPLNFAVVTSYWWDTSRREILAGGNCHSGRQLCLDNGGALRRLWPVLAAVAKAVFVQHWIVKFFCDFFPTIWSFFLFGLYKQKFDLSCFSLCSCSRFLFDVPWT